MNPDAAQASLPPESPRDRARSGMAARCRRWLAAQRVLLSYPLQSAAALMTRAVSSFKTRGPASTLRIIVKRLFPRARQPNALQLFTDSNMPEKVRRCEGAARASIIIPVHNQLDFTRRCLHSLTNCGDITPFEIIVVDDASTDGTAEALAGIEGLRTLRNIGNLGFIDSSNAGAALANGEFLVFLNNDTVVQPGWLDALLGTFEAHPDTGIAGSQLVYPDGRLQEAGGIVFADGSAANYGRNEDPADPRYGFVRQADYCSGAAIAVRRELFAQLQGFDTHFRPAYFEDTDLAMRVRQHGLKVRYQPASVVVHFEGVTAGTDVRHGVKAWQVRNQQRFSERWGELLQQYPQVDPARRDDTGLALAANHRARRQVLIIDSYTPTPDRDSGSVRMIELMRLLLEEDCAVAFFCQILTHDEAYTRALQQMGVEAWWRPWITNLPRWLREHGPRFDAIIVSRHYVLSPILPILRQLAPRAHIVFDTVDLHFLREQREAQASADAAVAARAARTRTVELDLINRADTTWVVSAVEQDLLQRERPAAKIEVLSNMHRIIEATPGFASRRDIVLVGSFRHPPNVDAAQWLASEIFPLVCEALPGLRLHLVGADAPESVRALGDLPGVQFRGHVADLEALLDYCRISVAPLRFGAGIKGKINQSLARGLPVVATTCAAEGMFLVDGEDVLRADGVESFAAAIVRLYTDEALWNRLRAGGVEKTRRHFSRDAARRTLRPWLQGLDARRDPVDRSP